MAENLLTPTSVKLYGREIQDISLTRPEPKPKPRVPGGLGDNLFLRRQLAEGDSRLARIYGFSYEGTYYTLPKPCMLLVHGEGIKASPEPPLFKPLDEECAETSDVPLRGATAPSTTDQSGVAAKAWEFSSDIQVWEYDKGDFSVRLDVETGCLEEILLEATIKRENLRAEYSGRIGIARRGGKLID